MYHNVAAWRVPNKRREYCSWQGLVSSRCHVGPAELKSDLSSAAVPMSVKSRELRSTACPLS